MKNNSQKNYSQFLPILFAVLLTAAFDGTARAQYKDYGFAVFETTVTRQGVETSEKNPSERRFYVSNVVEFSEGNAAVFRNAGKLADEYFVANVAEPLKAKGVLHSYYDDGIKINNNASYVESREDVEDLRKKVLEDLKEQNANVFTFNWTREKNANGLATSKPTLLYRGAEQPLYGAAEAKMSAPKTGEPAQNPPTAKTPTKKRPRKN